MSFAVSASPWAIAAVVCIIGFALVATYRRVRTLPTRRRWTLVALRAATFVILGLCLLRPVAIVPSGRVADAVVPIIVDASRSMRLRDVEGGRARFETARTMVRDRLLPALDPSFSIDVLAMSDELTATQLDRMRPDGRGSDLRGAVEAVRERYRGQNVAGIVLISDGAETTSEAESGSTGPPVYAIGVGSAKPVKDREVVAVAIGEARLTDSVVDLTATVVSRGYGGAPVELRVIGNGRAVHIRRVTPPDDGSPKSERFRVAPNLDAASVYTVEIATDPSELTTENNRYSVLVRPPGRPRRVLLVEGAPGYEHSFMKRAWHRDRGLEADSIVRKGRNDAGAATYYVQASKGRAMLLSEGYPTTREALFTYDAIVLANVNADLLSSEQMGLTLDFVAERGGGLLLMGGRSLAPAGLIRTALEELVPVEFSDRVGRAGVSATGGGRLNRASITPEGLLHPMMIIGANAEEARRQWESLPSLGATTALGAAKPGASVLAVTQGAGGAARPLVAVQRYGRGRSMVFAGEASWRWRMMLPSSNRSYETFWRQVGRWLAASAPEPVQFTVPAIPAGGRGTIVLDVRDKAYRPISDAAVAIRATDASGSQRDLQPIPDVGNPGRYTATITAEQAGLVRLDATVRLGQELVGVARDWALAGGVDREVADPRRNDDVLRRIARETGGEVVTAQEATRLRDLLVAAAATTRRGSEERELWHTPWMMTLMVGVLAAEWMLRRRWGLR